MSETGFQPPFEGLYDGGSDRGVVARAIAAFGRGTVDLYDSHPLHCALLGVAGGPDRADIDGELDALLVATVFAHRFPALGEAPDVLRLVSQVRHGPMLAALLDQDDVAAVVDALGTCIDRPWMVTERFGRPARAHRPLTELEVAAWGLVAPQAAARAAPLVGGSPVPTALADATAAIQLARAHGCEARAVAVLGRLVADSRVVGTWGDYRGPVLFVLEAAARGVGVDTDDQEVLVRLLGAEDARKVLPPELGGGRFDLTESFVAATAANRAGLRDLWAGAVEGRTTFGPAGAAHRRLAADGELDA